MDLDKLREKNIKYNSKWLFPVRMESSVDVRWTANIVEALGRFKTPVTQTIWDTCLRRNSIAAATPEENLLLRQWWSKGWREIPILSFERDKGTPILQIETKALGDTLELIYPNILSFQRQCNKAPRYLYNILNNIITDNVHWYKPLRKIQNTALEEKDSNKWTLFTPDNIIAGRFRTKLDIAAFLGCTRKEVDVTIASPQHQFFGGYWLWKDDWGFNPITPQGIELPSSWRIDCIQKQE